MPPPRPRSLSTRWIAAVGAVVTAAALGGCASGATSTVAADPEAIAARAGILGIAPDLVFTTEVDGFDLAPQSVGAADAEGMSATWFNADTGGMITLRTHRDEVTAESCAELPVWDAPDAPVTCTEEEGVWHREGAGAHEYLTAHDGAAILVLGVNGTSAEDLAAAARAVRVPTDADLALMFLDAPTPPATPTAPVERGDLPENGDGAPIDPVGPGG